MENLLESIIKNVKSDDLAQLRAVFGSSGGAIMESIADIFQIDLILDANVVLADVRWLTLSRKQEYARPRLLEVLECGTVQAFAPEFLEEEVQKHLPRIAQEAGVPISVPLGHWEKYKPYIQLVPLETGNPRAGKEVRDPKDLPYIEAQLVTGATICTNDNDIAAMGGRAVTTTVIATLQDYSRNAAVEYQIKLLGVGSFIVLEKTLELTVEIVRALTAGAKRAPKEVLWLGGVLLLASALHPKTRNIAFSLLKSLAGNTKKLEALLMHVADIIALHEEVKDKAELAVRDISDNC